MKLYIPLIAAAIISLSLPAFAHHNYTRPNLPDPARMLALYHFDNESGQVGTYFESPGFSTPRGLRVATPSAGGSPLSISPDVSYPVLGPNSIIFNDRQTLLTDVDFEETTADCTIEFWIKWQPGMVSSTLLVGANAGPKIHITRDNTNSLNDRFGIETAHGDFRSAPNFTDWTEWDSEPTTNGWWVMGMTIHSQGTETSSEPGTGHEDEVYKAGSYAIFFVNDHVVGDYNSQAQFLGKVDISGMEVHDHNNLYVRCDAGRGVMVDEFIFWKEDLTQGGTVLNGLFSNGRGTPASNVENWGIY